MLKKKLSEIRASKNSIDHYRTEGTYSIVEASYLVSLRVAKTSKLHTIGETLILPAPKEIVNSIWAQTLLSNQIQCFFLTTLFQKN
jgi:hypothetical protein